MSRVANSPVNVPEKVEVNIFVLLNKFITRIVVTVKKQVKLLKQQGKK